MRDSCQLLSIATRWRKSENFTELIRPETPIKVLYKQNIQVQNFLSCSFAMVQKL